MLLVVIVIVLLANIADVYISYCRTVSLRLLSNIVHTEVVPALVFTYILLSLPGSAGRALTYTARV